MIERKKKNWLQIFRKPKENPLLQSLIIGCNNLLLANISYFQLCVIYKRRRVQLFEKVKEERTCSAAVLQYYEMFQISPSGVVSSYKMLHIK